MAREETITNENQEQEKKSESVIENFGDVVENQEVEVVGNIEGIKDMGEEDVVSIKESDGSPEEVEEMKNVVDEATEEAKETKEKYEEDLKNIPNWEDKQESLKEKPIDRNELINNIKQTIEDYFSNVSLDDCQVLSGTAEYTSLLNYLDTRETNPKDSEKMKKMDYNEKREYMQKLCGECKYKMANDTKVRDFLNKNGSNLLSGNNKLNEVIKDVFSVAEYS